MSGLSGHHVALLMGGLSSEREVSLVSGRECGAALERLGAKVSYVDAGRDLAQVLTKLKPTAQQLDDLMFAWTVAKYVKSNAIVFCGGGMTLGVGAGQMSRIDSARIASIKAANAGLSLQGSAVASDAFFPFRDGLDVVIDQARAA